MLIGLGSFIGNFTIPSFTADPEQSFDIISLWDFNRKRYRMFPDRAHIRYQRAFWAYARMEAILNNRVARRIYDFFCVFI